MHGERGFHPSGTPQSRGDMRRDDVRGAETIVVDEPIEGLQCGVRAHRTREPLRWLSIEQSCDQPQPLVPAPVAKIRTDELIRGSPHLSTRDHEQG